MTVAVVVLLGVVVLGVLTRAVAQLAATAARGVTELSRAAEQLAVLSRSVAAQVESARTEVLEGGTRQVAFTVQGRYPGDPHADVPVPGAVVVRAQNAGDTFLHYLWAEYRPASGNSSAFQTARLLPPGSFIEWTFPLMAEKAEDHEFILCYTDARGRVWQVGAGFPVTVPLEIPEQPDRTPADTTSADPTEVTG